MKKILYFLSMIAVLIAVSVSSYAAEETERIDDRIALVHELGLIQGDNTGNLQLNKFITRAEAATILYRIMYGEDTPEASKQVFDDVRQNDWVAGYAERLYEMKIIEGDGSKFRPDDNVTTAEWYTMLLRLAGYTNYMANIDEYPANVMKTAAETELSKGIDAEADTILTREQVCVILYNLLDIEVIQLEVKGTNVSYRRGGSFMNDIMNIYTGKGVIDGVCGIMLDGTGISDDEISIGGDMYYNSINLGMDKIGMYGEYYYREDDDGTLSLIGFFPKHNSVLELGSEAIIGYEDGAYECYIDNRKKRINTDKGKDVVVNNEAVMNDENMCPFYGKVHMVDNNNDGNYDVIIINDYKNVLCSAVNSSLNIIYCDEKSGRNEINLNDFSDYKIFDSENNEITLDDIGKNTLLMLQYRSDNILYITVCDEVITDTVAKIGSDDFDRIVLTSEENSYTLSPSNNGFAEDVKIGETVTIHLDIFGNIGAISGDITVSGRQYGFIIKPVLDEDMESMSIKLLSQSGKIEMLKCSPKLKIDGQQATRDDLMNKIKYGDVIIYMQDSAGQIVKADTPMDKSSYIHTWDAADGYSIDNTWMRRAKGNLQFKSSQGALRRYTTMELDGQAFVEPSTVIFVVPDSETYTDESDYVVRAGNTINNDTQKKFAVYNDSPDSMTAQVLILYDNVKSLTSASRLMLVDKVNPTVNNDGDETYMVKGLYGGVDTEYTLKSEAESSLDGREIQQGDVLRVTIDGNSISACEILYSADGFGTLNNATYVGQSNYWDATYRYAVGTIEFVKNGKLIFTMDTADARPEFYDASKFSIYVYDKSRPKRDRITVGTADDIRDMTEYPDSYDTVIIGTAMSSGRELVLIKQ